MHKTFRLLALVALLPSVVLAQQCYTCKDTQGPGDCASFNGVMPTCDAGDAASCYRREFSDGSVERGCADTLTPEELTSCQAGNTGCKLCTGDRCNAKVSFQQCHRCDSIAENCPQMQGAEENLYTCLNYLDMCAIQIVGTQTIRGCASELSLPEFCTAITCTRCEGNNCNRGVFPINRLQCHTCTGDLDACFGDQSGNAQRRVCNNYILANDMCYAVLTTNRQIYRGCSSDADAGVTACENGNCDRCFGLIGCNYWEMRWRPRLSCIKCAINNPLCAWGFAASDAQRCENDVYLGQTESCYRRNLANGAAERGCSLDVVGSCAANDETCHTCTTSGCNRQSFNYHSCIQCRSTDADPSCRDPVPAELKATTCPGHEQQLADKGCYVLEQDNGHVVRGCLRYLDPELTAECHRKERCEICDENGCNDQPFGGTGALNAISLALVSVLAFIVQML